MLTADESDDLWRLGWLQTDFLECLEVGGFRPQYVQTAHCPGQEIRQLAETAGDVRRLDEEAVAPPMPAQSIEVFKNLSIDF